MRKGSKKGQLGLWICRVTHRRAATAGCHCISCDWYRSYRRQWRRDYFNKPGKREHLRRWRQARIRAGCPAQVAQLEKIRRYRTSQSRLVYLMYDQLRWMAMRDAMKGAT